MRHFSRARPVASKIEFRTKKNPFCTLVVCTFRDGDGEGGGEEKVSSGITGEACIQECIKLQNTNTSVNGVTVNRGTGGCWCEIGMTRIYNDQRFQTCFLERGNSQLKLSLSDQMYVCLSEDTFFTTLNTLLLSNFVSL